MVNETDTKKGTAEENMSVLHQKNVGEEAETKVLRERMVNVEDVITMMIMIEVGITEVKDTNGGIEVEGVGMDEIEIVIGHVTENLAETDPDQEKEKEETEGIVLGEMKDIVDQ